MQNKAITAALFAAAISINPFAEFAAGDDTAYHPVEISVTIDGPKTPASLLSWLGEDRAQTLVIAVNGRRLGQPCLASLDCIAKGRIAVSHEFKVDVYARQTPQAGSIIIAQSTCRTDGTCDPLVSRRNASTFPIGKIKAIIGPETH